MWWGVQGTVTLTSLSAVYRAWASLAKLSLMVWSCRPRPSAASLLSKGIVYPYEREREKEKERERLGERILILDVLVLCVCVRVLCCVCVRACVACVHYTVPWDSSSLRCKEVSSSLAVPSLSPGD